MWENAKSMWKCSDVGCETSYKRFVLNVTLSPIRGTRNTGISHSKLVILERISTGGGEQFVGKTPVIPLNLYSSFGALSL